MSVVCPAGHSSQSDDYCDVCGMPIDASPGAAPAGALPPAPDAPADAATGVAAVGGHPCPHCGTPNPPDALFCENCGYDYTTGTAPRPAEVAAPNTGTIGDAAEAQVLVENAAPETFEWVAELWIDPAWFEAQDSPDSLPSPGLPEVLPLRAPSLLIGRRSASRNINPEIDCGADSGVSRRQAQLTTDGRRWFVEDLDSANGTFVGSASGALPTDPIAVGTKHELDADDRIYVGAWTRLVIREATDDELTSLS